MIRGPALYFLCVLLAALVSSCVFMAALPAIRRLAGHLSSLWTRLDSVGKVVVVALLCVFGYRGATKSMSMMSKTSYDESIGLAAAEMAAGALATNIVSQSAIDGFGHGTNIVAYSFSATNLQITAEEFASKIYWRDSNREKWERANTGSPYGLDVAYWTEYSSPTTTVYILYGPTNRFEHAMFYVGDDLPPVYIEAEGGIALDSVQMTSKKMTVTYTIDASALTGPATVVFERNDLTEHGSWPDHWEAMRTISASAGTHQEQFVGFFVAKRHRFRIRLLVEVSE